MSIVLIIKITIIMKIKSNQKITHLQSHSLFLTSEFYLLFKPETQVFLSKGGVEYF